MWRALLPVIVLGACRPAGPPVEAADPAAAREDGSVGDDEAGSPEAGRVRTLVQPWHHVDPAWLEAATVVVTGQIRESSYPCVFHADGSHDMPMARTVTVTEVIRQGPLRRQDFDFAAPGRPSLGFPARYVEGRRYLFLLRPGEESAARLSDATHVFGLHTQLGQRDLVAVVDLDQTQQEAEARRAEVETWERRERFELTDERWREIRGRQGVSAEDLATALHALRGDRLGQWCTRPEVRAALGDPDQTRQQGGEAVEVYFVNVADRAAPRAGTLVARVELTYDAGGQILEYAESFDLFEAGAFREATYEEKRARGLTWVREDRRRGSLCPRPTP